MASCSDRMYSTRKLCCDIVLLGKHVVLVSKWTKRVKRMSNGQKLGFEPADVAVLRSSLAHARDYQGSALLNVAVDTMLRVSDLRRLRVSDLRHTDGSWRESFAFGMRKEQGRTVVCYLLKHSHDALQAYVTAYRLMDDYLL